MTQHHRSKIEFSFEVNPGALGDTPQTWQDQLVRLAQAGASAFAGGILPGAGGFVMSAILKALLPDVAVTEANLSESALRAIANIVQQAIDENELAKLKDVTSGAAGALKAYGETKDKELLGEDLMQLFVIIPPWQRRGPDFVGGFSMAANLHLSAVLARAEYYPGYKDTYARLRVEYGNHVIDNINAIRQQKREMAAREITGCRGQLIPNPSGFDSDPDFYRCAFGDTQWIDPDNVNQVGPTYSAILSYPDSFNESKQKECCEDCERHRTLWLDQQVHNVTTDLDPIEQAARAWLGR